jgi:hypothetical protein
MQPYARHADASLQSVEGLRQQLRMDPRAAHIVKIGVGGTQAGRPINHPRRGIRRLIARFQSTVQATPASQRMRASQFAVQTGERCRIDNGSGAAETLLQLD